MHQRTGSFQAGIKFYRLNHSVMIWFIELFNNPFSTSSNSNRSDIYDSIKKNKKSKFKNKSKNSKFDNGRAIIEYFRQEADWSQKIPN